ncbi:MAG TPA: hypothetical protein VNL35_00715 [Chloroflexota bacterium]|nr:hypothetical protein [Chloroflexota bacterium]
MAADARTLLAARQINWGQSAQTRTPDPVAAAALIDRLGIATLYPVSPELPDLLHAYTGDPSTTTDSHWDSPTGHIYAWRWELGRQEAAFYTAIVRGRPTLVAWSLLPSVLRLRADLRGSEHLYASGLLSEGAARIARALDSAGGVLGTSELRQAAGFPTGKEQRAAFLKAVAELDARLLLAKVFSPDDEDMRHALVATRYPEALATARDLDPAAAMDALLVAYLPSAVFALPGPLAKHLGLEAGALRAGLDRLVAAGVAESAAVTGLGECTIWR